MSDSILIEIVPSISGFAEDKDYAKGIRIEKLLPALTREEKIILDFGKVTFATQSFVHALIGEAIKKHGNRCLELIQFKGCSSQLQSLIELVVDYSSAGFQSVSQVSAVEPDKKVSRKKKR